MIAFLRRIAAVAATAVACSAGAVSTLTDYTDLWFTASEPGHGLYIVQNGETLFLTMFVYGGDTLPRWYYASDIRPVNGSNTQWTGQLVRSTGTSFASPWNPAQLFTTVVGNVTLNFTSPSQATMTFTVDNIPVTQQITRFTFINETLAGVYAGGLTANMQCGSSPATPLSATDRLTVQHTPPGNPRFIVDFRNDAGVPATCTFTGNYSQQGKIGTLTNGTFTCTGGSTSAGTFSMAEVAVNRNGLSAHVSGTLSGCNLDGYFGGIRDVQ
jgi:hypothetical protein